MSSILPTNSNPKENQPSIIGSVARGSLKIAQAGGLAVGGVALMMIGLGGAYVTTTKIKEFYFDEHNKNDLQGYRGYREFPGFENGCKWMCSQAYTYFKWPPENSEFCKSMADKPFSQQEGAFAAASLVTSMGLSSICYLASLYSFLGGLSLMGRSIEVFTSIL